MSKSLIIGDLHVMPTNIQDTKKIFDKIKDLESSRKDVKRIIFTGDIFHTHNILRQDVSHFVAESFKDLSTCTRQSTEIIVDTGNHDLIGPANDRVNANNLILGGVPKVIIVDRANVGYASGPYSFVPFIPNKEEFLKILDMMPENNIVVCHQTIDGAKYENGFYAPDGIDLGGRKNRIIGGHIHTTMELGKNVFYVGSPRAITWSEANHDKGVFIINDENWEDREFISLNDQVKCFKLLTATDDGPVDLTSLDLNKDDVRVKVEGTQEFYERFLTNNQHLIGKVKLIPNIKKSTKKALSSSVESDSLMTTLKEYVFSISEVKNKDVIWQRLQKMLNQ